MGPDRRIAPAVALLAATLALGLVAGAALAGVTVYKNNFSGKSQAKELRHSDGKHCDKRWRKKSKAVLVEVKRGSGACVYRPPVAGDRDRPDHDFQARVKLLRATPKGIRRTSYLGIAVRAGNSTRYELRIFPRQHKYVVRRKPGGGGTGFPKQGKTRAVKGVDKANVLRLKAFGNTVTAKVNRRRVAQLTDSNAGQVGGRKLEVFVGQKRRTRKDVTASVDNLRLQVPNPQ